MSKTRFVTAGALLAAMGAAQPALPSALGCSGELTLDRFAAADCSARIPLPSPRPTMAADGPAAEIADAKWDYMEVAGAAPGETRRIRLVGPRFLPPRSEDIDFEALSASNEDPINALVHRAAAYFASVKADDKVADAGSEAENVLETHVALQIAPTRNQLRLLEPAAARP